MASPDPAGPSGRTAPATAITHGRILAIALPIVASNATIPLLGVVDTAIIGQLGQAAAIGAVGLGALLTYGIATVIPGSVPFALDTGLVVGYGGVLLVVALLGTLLSLRRIAAIDPLMAIGRMD